MNIYTRIETVKCVFRSFPVFMGVWEGNIDLFKMFKNFLQVHCSYLCGAKIVKLLKTLLIFGDKLYFVSKIECFQPIKYICILVDTCMYVFQAIGIVAKYLNYIASERPNITFTIFGI